MGFANADLFSSNENNRDKSKTLPDMNLFILIHFLFKSSQK